MGLMNAFENGLKYKSIFFMVKGKKIIKFDRRVPVIGPTICPKNVVQFYSRGT